MPIYAGATGPLISTAVDGCCSKEYHGEDGLGDSPETYPAYEEADFKAQVSGKHAVQAIIDTIHEHPGTRLASVFRHYNDNGSSF